MSKAIEIPDIAQWEETDSELAKYTIGKLQEENRDLQERIDKAIEILEKDENKEPIEVILDNVGKVLDILKGGNNE